MMITSMRICEISKCTGCFACKAICAHNAISVSTDEFGKTIPSIIAEKCIDCGLCKKICPINEPIKLVRAKYAVAAVSMNQDDRKKSSSGGCATVLARKIISRGGIVFGAASINRNIEQIKINSLEGLELLRGSKYVQSDTKNTYQEAKTALKEKKEVLYVGTPCQIAGLRSFLRQDYDNLYTVDLICHGTPPVQYLYQYINGIIKNRNWDKVAFRGENDFQLTVFSQGRIVYKRKARYDLYFSAFLDGLIYRDNCYACPYARLERSADLTLGDFWGLDRSQLHTEITGRVSVVLPNTYKGERLLELCKDEMVMEVRTLGEASNPQQGNLLHPTIPHKERKVFLEHYTDVNFMKSISITSLGKETKKAYKNYKRTAFFRGCKKVVHLIKKKVK